MSIRSPRSNVYPVTFRVRGTIRTVAVHNLEHVVTMSCVIYHVLVRHAFPRYVAYTREVFSTPVGKYMHLRPRLLIYIPDLVLFVCVCSVTCYIVVRTERCSTYYVGIWPSRISGNTCRQQIAVIVLNIMYTYIHVYTHTPV